MAIALKKGIIISVVLFLIVNQTISAQKSDSDLLQHTDFTVNKYDNRRVSFGFSKEKNRIVRYNPISVVLSGAMYIYQRVVSPQILAGCLYTPSCSEYSRQLIKTFGIFKGTFCSADRLMRCNSCARRDFPKNNHLKKHIVESVDIYRFK